MSDNNETEQDPWGDEDDDMECYFALSTMDAEQENRVEEFRTQNQPPLGSQGVSPSTETNEVFNIRRQHYYRERQVGAPMSQQPGLPESDLEAQIRLLNEKVEAEKEKNDVLTRKFYEAQGASSIVRRELEAFKSSRQQEMVNHIKTVKEQNLKHEAEKRELIQKLKDAEVQLRSLSNSNIATSSKLKAKSLTNYAATASSSFSAGSSQRLSVGGRGSSPRKGASVGPRQLTFPTNAATVAKFKSDPHLPGNTSALQLNADSTPPPMPTEKLKTSEAAVQVDHNMEILLNSLKDALSGDTAKIQHLESISSLTDMSYRRKIFISIESLISKEYLNVESKLENFVNVIPKEIMARFATGPKFNAYLPTLKDTMYLVGIQKRKKKEDEEKGLIYEEPKYPILPSIHNSPVLNLNKLRQEIEAHITFGGIWTALLEIKKNLKKLFEHLNGEMRFKLFQLNNISVLWHLLAWASYLWRMIAFEEELEDVVNNRGKGVWISELKEWSGLILKTDWRDFYNNEMEFIIRRFSLSILESIITLGYFEEQLKRYEILYCILKDTLLNCHFSTEALISRCLTITTWSVAEGKIFNYLCLGLNKDKTQNPNCLARILGEKVLKCFKGAKSPEAAAKLLVCYLNLLENLMVKHPHYLYTSKIARPQVNARRLRQQARINARRIDDDSSESDSEEDEDGEHETEEKISDENLLEEEEMDVDLDYSTLQSQFACPDKYKFEDGSKERAEKFINAEKVSCWIDPKNWEVPMGFRGEKPCQCRKILLESAFIMLYLVTKFWAQAYLDHEESVELLEKMDKKQLRVQMETGEMDDQLIQKLEQKTSSFRSFIVEFITETRTREKEEEEDEDEKERDRDYDIVLEWSWDEILRCKEKMDKDSAEEPEWVAEKRRTETIFDYVIRQGVVLMGFCLEKSNNLALAVGSEGYSCYAFLEAFFRFYEQNLHISIVEKRIVIGSTRINDSDSEYEFDDGKIFDIDRDDMFSDVDVSLNATLDKKEILNGIENSKFVKFSEAEFDKAFRHFETETASKGSSQSLNQE